MSKSRKCRQKHSLYKYMSQHFSILTCSLYQPTHNIEVQQTRLYPSSTNCPIQAVRHHHMRPRMGCSGMLRFYWVCNCPWAFLLIGNLWLFWNVWTQFVSHCLKIQLAHKTTHVDTRQTQHWKKNMKPKTWVAHHQSQMLFGWSGLQCRPDTSALQVGRSIEGNGHMTGWWQCAPFSSTLSLSLGEKTYLNRERQYMQKSTNEGKHPFA